MILDNDPQFTAQFKRVLQDAGVLALRSGLDLSTAFMVYSAWRSAVRDAEAADVEAGDEPS